MECNYKVFAQQVPIGTGVIYGNLLYLYTKTRYKYVLHEYDYYQKSLFSTWNYLGSFLTPEKEQAGINILPEQWYDPIVNILLGRRCILIPLGLVEIPKFDGKEVGLASLSINFDSIEYNPKKYPIIRDGVVLKMMRSVLHLFGGLVSG